MTKKNLSFQVERSKLVPVADYDFAQVDASQFKNAGETHPSQRTRDTLEGQAEVIGNIPA
jgi:hypothetical protein